MKSLLLRALYSLALSTLLAALALLTGAAFGITFAYIISHAPQGAHP